MKNYIVYDRNGNMLRRFETQEEGEKYADHLALDWANMGRKGLSFKVCYNGRESVEVYRVES